MNEARYRAAEQALWTRVSAAPTERFLDVPRDDGTNARVRVQEVGAGPALVFIHGSPNSGSIYASLAARLSSSFRCILLDRPGTGLSDVITGDRRDVVVRVLDAVLDGVLNPDERAHIVGSSIGGWWALVYALARGHRVDRMIQHGCPAGLPGERLPWGVRMMALPGMAAMMKSMTPTPASVRMTFGFIGHKPAVADGRIDATLLDWYLALVRDTDTQKHEVTEDARVLRFFSPLMKELALDADALRALQSPTAILWGTNDNFGGVDVARHARSVLPGEELTMIEGAGHLPWLDDLAAAEAHARAFLKPSLWRGGLSGLSPAEGAHDDVGSCRAGDEPPRHGESAAI